MHLFQKPMHLFQAPLSCTVRVSSPIRDRGLFKLKKLREEIFIHHAEGTSVWGAVTMLTERVVVEGVMLHIPRKYNFSYNTLVITFFCSVFLEDKTLYQNYHSFKMSDFVCFILFFVLFFLIGIHSMQGSTATRRHEVTRKRSTKRSGLELSHRETRIAIHFQRLAVKLVTL